MLVEGLGIGAYASGIRWIRGVGPRCRGQEAADVLQLSVQVIIDTGGYPEDHTTGNFKIGTPPLQTLSARLLQPTSSTSPKGRLQC